MGAAPGQLLLLLLAAAPHTLAVAQPTANTTDGVVRGRVYAGCNVFRGVPFAEPPTGPLRWRSPRPKEPWRDVREAAIPAAQCPQLDLLKGLYLGKEDCLYLSVYSPPSCTSDSPCPVMFWIYGGAWSIGGNGEFGLYTGQHLAMKHGVVVVSTNYRLDVLGWLALEELTGDDGGYANWGLRDQTLALHWTQANVRSFGGDPAQVTIFGESAGGFSVCQHITSPASNGLFSRAIMESADCDGPWMIVDGVNAKNFGDHYATLLGCPPGSRAQCLRSLSPGQLMVPYTSWFCPPGYPRPQDPWCNITLPGGADASRDAARAAAVSPGESAGHLWPVNRAPFAPIAGWTAVVDGSEGGLPDTPLRMIEQGRVNRGPDGAPLQMIFGTNQDELALFLIAVDLLVPGIALPLTAEATPQLGQHVVSYHDRWNASTTAAITAAYPSAGYATEAYRLSSFGTDALFRCGTRRAARALSAAGHDVYLYNFNYHFSLYREPASRACQEGTMFLCGAYHASELRFVFDNFQIPFDKPDQEMARSMGSLWSNFAKSGSPNMPARTGGGGEELLFWPRYNASSDLHMELARPFAVEAGLRREQCDFWDSLPRQDGYPH